jgi:hypothetical protein
MPEHHKEKKMTAPIYFKPDHKAQTEEMLPILTNKLLDAIDKQETTKAENYLALALKREISHTYICMIYRYARAHKCASICDYIGDIMAATSNISLPKQEETA